MDVAERIRTFWDTDADTYDLAAAHRPTSPAERAAWAGLLDRTLPPPPARILDCGAGTGFLSLMAARRGHDVTALDLSSRMLDQLRRKADDEGLRVEVREGSAGDPPPGPFDAVIERHLIWTLPEPVATLQAWQTVAPVGRLVLIEGLWGRSDRVETWKATGRHRLRQLRRAWSAIAGAEPPHPEHHADYSADIRDALPFGQGTPLGELVQAVADAGWSSPRFERLRDIEWAATLALPWPDRIFGVPARFVITAG